MKIKEDSLFERTVHNGANSENSKKYYVSFSGTFFFLKKFTFDLCFSKITLDPLWRRYLDGKNGNEVSQEVIAVVQVGRRMIMAVTQGWQ